MIRLRPTQILLTSEEVNKAFQNIRSSDIGSMSSSATLPWDHNITIRRNRNTKKADKNAQSFIIHEDSRTTDCEYDNGEISDMSDFSFGPILLKRSLSDENALFAEGNSSSEAGDEGSGGERSTASTSWDERQSVATLTNDSPTNDSFISSTLIDGSISSADEQEDISLKNSQDDVEQDFNSEQGECFIDIEYMADIELSVLEDSDYSTQDSDIEKRFQESYSLPMDGTNEASITQRFEDLSLYASPVVPRDDEISRSPGFPFSGIPGTPGTPVGVFLPPTPPSVRRLLEEISPRLDEVAGLSPRHLAVSRARLARYRSRSLQHSTLTRQAADPQVEGDRHQRSRTTGASRQWLLNSSLPESHIKCRVFSTGARSMVDELYDTDDSDGGIEILVGSSETEIPTKEDKEDETGDLDSSQEDAARKLFG